MSQHYHQIIAVRIEIDQDNVVVDKATYNLASVVISTLFPTVRLVFGDVINGTFFDFDNQMNGKKKSGFFFAFSRDFFLTMHFGHFYTLKKLKPFFCQS